MASLTILGLFTLALHIPRVVIGISTKESPLTLVAAPSARPSGGDELQLQCQVTPSEALSAVLTTACTFRWTHAYLPARDGPRIETLQSSGVQQSAGASSSSGASGGGVGRNSNVVIYDVVGPLGLPFKSVLRIGRVHEAMEGTYHCMLECPAPENTLATVSVDIRISDDRSHWLRRDLAMMLVSLVVVIFITSMLVAGLVLRVRQCYRQRQFMLQQEQLSTAYDTASLASTSSSTDGDSCSINKPPPRYSEIVDADDLDEQYLQALQYSLQGNNAAVLSSQYNPSSPTIPTIAHNIPICANANVLLSCGASVESEFDFCDSQDTMSTLTDFNESANFDTAHLTISLPDYDEALEDLERRGLKIDSLHLKPMPPAYSQLSLHV